MIRLLKVVLAAFTAFFCIMYALQNIVNLQAAYGFVALIVGMEGHLAYPEHAGPAVQSSMFVWALLWVIIVLEISAGLLAAKGALDLWSVRNGSADEFNNAKTYAILGTGLGVVVWFGLFGSVAGAYFQMWQTAAGANAAAGAFQYTMQMGLVLLIINATDK